MWQMLAVAAAKNKMSRKPKEKKKPTAALAPKPGAVQESLGHTRVDEGEPKRPGDAGHTRLDEEQDY